LISVKQDRRPPGIFRRHHIDLFKNLQSPQRNIAQISNRRPNQVEGRGFMVHGSWITAVSGSRLESQHLMDTQHLRLKTEDLKMRLIALWHQSLIRSKKSRSREGCQESGLVWPFATVYDLAAISRYDLPFFPVEQSRTVRVLPQRALL
jgi:hypothetical protein